MTHPLRRSAPRRGPATLLALMLGAAVAWSGCSDDTASTTPAPTPVPPTAPTPEPEPDPTLGAPNGLRVAATGSDFVEFSWNAVDGASNYEIQMSRTAGDFSSVTTATVTGTMHRFSVEASTTVYARVRAMASGVRSGWSGAVSGTTMAAPLMLSAPMPEVSDTGPDYIEWSWDAVEDALAYEVQVAGSEGDLGAAELVRVAGTTHRVTADPLQTMYIRVRAAAGTTTAPVVSEWSGAVAGQSLASPGVFTVRMNPPASSADMDCHGQAFCPDEGTNPTTAKANVNTRMTVTSSQPARITPVFLTGTPGAGITAGDSTPFRYLDWSAPQADIAGDGVTFRFDRVTAGAGQEPTPTGETMYITCGPFRCSDASTDIPPAPELSIRDSATCNDFDPRFEPEIGAVRNTGLNLAMGIDLGWTYTVNAAAEVTHVVAGATNLRVDGGDVRRTSTRTSLPVERRRNDEDVESGPDFGGRVDNSWGDDPAVDDFGVRNLMVTTGGPIRNGVDDCFFGTYAELDEHDTTGWTTTAFQTDWGSYEVFGNPRSSSGVRRPASCMRIITDDTAGCNAPNGAGCSRAVTRGNYLEGYSLEIKPDASVTWIGSAVKWPAGQDPFDDLDCAPTTVEASDHVDVCELFEDEVDLYIGRGVIEDIDQDSRWGRGGEFRLRPILLHGGNGPDHGINGDDFRWGNIVAIQLARNLPHAPKNLRAMGRPLDSRYLFRPNGSRFLSLWLSETASSGTDDPDGGADQTRPLGIDGTVQDRDLYYPSPRHAFQHYMSLRPFGFPDSPANRRQYDLSTRGQVVPVGGFAQRAIATFPIFDKDGNPMYGDLGKLDLGGAVDPDNPDVAVPPDGKAEGTYHARYRDCDASDGGESAPAGGVSTLCDAEDVELGEQEVTFVLNKDATTWDTCEVTRTVTLTCQWDADGQEARQTMNAVDLNLQEEVRYFLSCEGSWN